MVVPYPHFEFRPIVLGRHYRSTSVCTSEIWCKEMWVFFGWHQAHLLTSTCSSLMTDRYRVRQTNIEAAVCFCQMLHPVPNFICNASVEVVNSLLRNVVLCPMEFFFLQCRFTLRNRHLKGDTLRRHYGRLSRIYWYTVRMKIIRVFQLSVHAKHTTLWLAAVRCFKLLVQVFI